MNEFAASSITVSDSVNFTISDDTNPSLSQMAFELSKAMELLASSMGWEWTNNILIREHLWPVLKKWTLGLRSENNGIKNGSACLVMKIIGKIGLSENIF